MALLTCFSANNCYEASLVSHSSLKFSTKSWDFSQCIFLLCPLNFNIVCYTYLLSLHYLVIHTLCTKFQLQKKKASVTDNGMLLDNGMVLLTHFFVIDDISDRLGLQVLKNHQIDPISLLFTPSNLVPFLSSYPILVNIVKFSISFSIHLGAIPNSTSFLTVYRITSSALYHLRIKRNSLFFLLLVT